MDAKARVLAELIDRRGSRRAFAESIGLPPTTLQSMLTRGVGRASIDNVMKVCRALGITVEQLESMAQGREEKGKNVEIGTIAAHHDGEDWTEEELEEIERFKAFVRMKRQQKQE